MSSRFRAYCSNGKTGTENKINVPENLPEFLMKFSKAAIQSQPADLLQWSLKYFLALSNEYQETENEYHPEITVGILRVLHSQFKNNPVTVKVLHAAWDSLFLDRKLLTKVLSLEGFSQKLNVEVDWMRFLAHICRAIMQNMEETMEYICKVVTECPAESEPEIPTSLFESFYIYLARFEPTISEDHVDDVITYLHNNIMDNISPADFNHPSFPRLSGQIE